MQAGDLIGFTTPDKFGAVIRFGQHRLQHLEHWQVNHIAIVAEVVGNDALIVQAVRTINKVWLSSYGETQHVVVAFPGMDNRRADVVAFAESKLGLKYGVFSVLSRALNMLTPKIIQVDANRAGRMDCSALAVRSWEHGGVIVPWPDPWQVVPGQIPDSYREAA